MNTPGDGFFLFPEQLQELNQLNSILKSFLERIHSLINCEELAVTQTDDFTIISEIGRFTAKDPVWSFNGIRFSNLDITDDISKIFSNLDLVNLHLSYRQIEGAMWVGDEMDPEFIAAFEEELGNEDPILGQITIAEEINKANKMKLNSKWLTFSGYFQNSKSEEAIRIECALPTQAFNPRNQHLLSRHLTLELSHFTKPMFDENSMPNILLSSVLEENTLMQARLAWQILNAILHSSEIKVKEREG